MTIKLIPGRGMYANAYLAQGTVLVDAGITPMSVEAHRESIKYIVLTHCHFDHIAYLGPLVSMTGAKVCIHAADADGLREDNLNLAMQFGSHSPGIIPDIILEDGNQLEGLEVIHTPGHTPGSICLYNKETRDLISGDTVFSDGAFGRYDFPGGSRETLSTSLDRVADLEVKGLYPGHGLPALDHGERHIKAAQALMRSGYA
ncbi:MBL fold metallo-hydrolase [Methanospirillum lacunae]|nr:MBL fold metallo-hydrolase [Methanospirillum lacunae]